MSVSYSLLSPNSPKGKPGQMLHIPLATQFLGNLYSRLIFCSINLDFVSVLKISTQTYKIFKLAKCQTKKGQ